MFGRANFRDCITDNLKTKGFGEKRTKTVLKRFERFARQYDEQGLAHPDADMRAMQDTFNELDRELREKTKRISKDLQVTAENANRVKQAFTVRTSSWTMDGKGGNKLGVAIGRAGISLYTHDPRFTGLSLEGVRNALVGKYGALLADVMDNFRKGAFGRQVGSAHLPNVARELFGSSTGDVAAKEIATAVKKLFNTAVDDYNIAGGTMRKREDFNIPQKQNPARLIKNGPDVWVKEHLDWIDWNKTRWPDGEVIDPTVRNDVLRRVWNTLSTDGGTNITPKELQSGRIISSAEFDRFLVYKNADAWLAMHEKYGDGNVFDVVSSYLHSMAHKTAAVQILGNNANTGFKRIVMAIRAQAANAQAVAVRTGDKKGLTAVADADAIIKNKLEPLHIMMTHQNPVDVSSPLANVLQTTSHVLTSAQLGSILFAAMPSDFVTTLAARFVNHMPLISGVGSYISGMLPGGYAKAEKIAARAGFVFDETISATYAAERFTGLATYGPALSSRLSDATMRAGLITRHTNIARWVNVKEMMGLLDDMRETDFDKLPFKFVMERYGITSKEWDAVRKLPAWSPNGKATFMSPQSILDTNWITKNETYFKFRSMLDGESRVAVPSATFEGAHMLKGLSRPDTISGAMLHSFAMYKNFPASVFMTYGRQLLATPRANKRFGIPTRTGFIAGLGLGMVAVGAISTQLKEISKGRTPLPMDTSAFWGKAILASGGLSLWGDFLFTGINEVGRGPAETAAGPLAGLASDTANMVMGDGFAWTEAFDRGKEWDLKTGGRVAEFAKRYTPGTNVWWARLVLEREVWDRMQYWLDPSAAKKWRRRIRRQERDFGNTYWAPPGEPFTGN